MRLLGLCLPIVWELRWVAFCVHCCLCMILGVSISVVYLGLGGAGAPTCVRWPQGHVEPSSLVDRVDGSHGGLRQCSPRHLHSRRVHMLALGRGGRVAGHLGGGRADGRLQERAESLGEI